MASQYATVFPRLPREEPTRNEKIDAVKQAFAEQSTIDIATEYARLRGEKARVEGWLSEVNTKLEAIQQLLIVSQEHGDENWGAYGAGKNMLRLVTGDKIEVRDEISVKVTDKDLVRQWAISEGLERHLTIHANTLAGIVREMLASGEPEPPGVAPSWWRKIVFTPMKGK